MKTLTLFTLLTSIFSWTRLTPSTPLEDSTCQPIVLWDQSDPLSWNLQDKPDFNVEPGNCIKECCSTIECQKHVSQDGRTFKNNDLNKFAVLCLFGKQSGNNVISLDQASIYNIETVGPQEARYGHQSIARQISIDNLVRKYVLLFGGTLLSGEITDQVWQYEVAWAPQYYYSPSHNRGNEWVQMKFLPQPLSYHAVCYDNISRQVYIFGGQSGQSTYSRGLYAYDVTFDKYRLLDQNVISVARHQVIFWDNSIYVKEYSGLALQEFLVTYIKMEMNTQRKYTIEMSSPLANVNNCEPINGLPDCLTSHKLIYSAECHCLYLIGGINSTNEYNANIWIYSLTLSSWIQLLQIDQPRPRIGFDVTNAPLLGPQFWLLFGGQNQTGLMDDYWIFDLDKNAWTQITNKTMTDSTNWPDPTSGHQLVAANNQLFIIGAQIYSTAATMAHGVINYGFSRCDDGWNGVACDQRMCPGVCFDIMPNERICYECYGNGHCEGGKCQCDPGYGGDDCHQLITCPNNCSSAEKQSIGSCISIDPYPQCRCSETQKRGADDCSVIFCLNDCSNNGQCVKGECQCNTNYYGADCGVMGIQFISDDAALLSLILLIIIL